MCIYFDAQVPRQCLEDGAEEVQDKLKMNFCDWFKPSSSAFDPMMADQESRAKDELATLFGDGQREEPGSDTAIKDAEDLFK
jgi:hypothetical protein